MKLKGALPVPVFTCWVIRGAVSNRIVLRRPKPSHEPRPDSRAPGQWKRGRAA